MKINFSTVFAPSSPFIDRWAAIGAITALVANYICEVDYKEPGGEIITRKITLLPQHGMRLDQTSACEWLARPLSQTCTSTPTLTVWDVEGRDWIKIPLEEVLVFLVQNKDGKKVNMAAEVAIAN
jgi:hypothetical protein